MHSSRIVQQTARDVRPVRFVVIGVPGSGKSTVLNEFLRQRRFETRAGGRCCTQIGAGWDERNAYTVAIQDGGVTYQLELLDTPGFPDPDPQYAATHYDHVIQQCNRPINGVLFVVNGSDRETAAVMGQYRAMLSQFVYFRPPLILLVNGMENPSSWEREEPDFEQRKAEAVEDLRGLGLAVLRATGLHAREIMVSYCREDLYVLGRHVARIFSSAPAEESQMLTFAQLNRQLQAGQNELALREQQERDCAERINRCRRDIKSLEDEASSLVIAAAATCWIPWVGALTVGVLLAVAASKQRRIAELAAEIGDTEREQAAVQAGEGLRRRIAENAQAVASMSRFFGHH